MGDYCFRSSSKGLHDEIADSENLVALAEAMICRERHLLRAISQTRCDFESYSRTRELMIDTSFNVYSDTPKGKDPDQWSPTMRRYHAILWSKPLPDGRPFSLSTEKTRAYLSCNMHGEVHVFASDSIGHTYRNSKPVSDVIAQVPTDELDAFFSHASTIGAYTIFPGKTIQRKPTINGARGMHPRVGDRFDLTLECIRCHYMGTKSPLSEPLARYGTFFNLFRDFAGYVDFFLFHDLVDAATGQIRFFLPHDDFSTSPYPRSLSEYRAYRNAVCAFISGRNARISDACRTRNL